MLVAVAAVAIVAATKRGRASNEPWVDAPREAGPAVVPRGALLAYQLTYQVDAGVPLGSALSTETLSVLRPWGSRLVTRSGAPPGGAVTDELASDFGKLRIKPAAGTATVLATAADLAASDLRPDVGIDDVVSAGLARWGERRRVLDRACQVLTTTTPPQGQQLGALTAGGGDLTESCIDGDGLILEQLRLSNNRLLLRRRAVQVDTTPALDPATFPISEASTIPPAQGGGSVVQVDPSTLPPGPTWFLDRPADGFVFQGHYAIAEPAPTDNNGQPNPNRRAGFTDVWRRGPDVLVLDQGGTLYGGAPFGPAPGAHPVDLGGLGGGEAIPGIRLSVVRVAQSGGRYVRLAGTVPLDELVTLARTLRRAERAA